MFRLLITRPAAVALLSLKKPHQVRFTTARCNEILREVDAARFSRATELIHEPNQPVDIGNILRIRKTINDEVFVAIQDDYPYSGSSGSILHAHSTWKCNAKVINVISVMNHLQHIIDCYIIDIINKTK
jgi:hypothetical protein